jgi:hypothetical protein
MKRIIAIALFAVTTMLGAGHALAQTDAVRATIPFDFTVGSKLLPSGTYTIISVSEDMIEIRNNNLRLAILSTAIPDSEVKAGCNLIFHKYAGQYFLREVAGGLCSFDVNLPSSKSEEKARRLQRIAFNERLVSIPASVGY